MKVKIYGSENNTKNLLTKVESSLDELGLKDFIELETTNDEELKNELNIEKEPALIVVEESIDFKDTIFEGIEPSSEEIKSMFISIIGGGESGGGCATDSCGTCSSGC